MSNEFAVELQRAHAKTETMRAKNNELNDTVYALQQELSALKAQQAERWIPVSERLPDLDTPVWLYEPEFRGVFVGMRSAGTDGWLWAECSGFQMDDDGSWESVDAYFDDFRPTLWMPLPTAPTQGGDV